MPIPVIRIPVEIDSSEAKKNLRDLRFQFNALEREAKSVGESLSSSIAAVQSGNLASAAQASGLNNVASRNRGGVLFAAANAADMGSEIRIPKAPRVPKGSLGGNAFGPLTKIATEEIGDLIFDTEKELRSALDDFRFNSGLIGEEFADRVRQAQKIALNANTTASLVLDEFSRIALTDFDLLKKPRALEAEARAGIARDLREEEDARIRMGEDELARASFEREGKPLVESFRISRGFESTLDDQLDDTIFRLEECPSSYKLGQSTA